MVAVSATGEQTSQESVEIIKMKVVKLNRRYKAFKNYGHTYAFRFDVWSRESGLVEDIMSTMLGSQYTGNFHNWRATFSERPQSNMPRPYFISFRDESIISLVLLKMEMNDDI